MYNILSTSMSRLIEPQTRRLVHRVFQSIALRRNSLVVMLFRRLPVLAVSAALVRSVVSLEPRSLYSLSARSLDGHEVPLSEYKGRVSLVVNVACE
jgi:hypothetical protein